MNNLPLTDHELNVINFKLASDNNAMLRILLENQLKVMDTLGISNVKTKFSLESVSAPVISLPDGPIPADELSRVEYGNNINAAKIIAKNIRQRSQEWIEQNVDDSQYLNSVTAS